MNKINIIIIMILVWLLSLTAFIVYDANSDRTNREFDIKQTAESNKMDYMKIAKYLLYLKEVKLTNGYAKRYDKVSETGLQAVSGTSDDVPNPLKGRRKQVYDEITWLIDMYSPDKKTYERFVTLLDKTIKDYKEMVSQQPLVQEEVIK